MIRILTLFILVCSMWMFLGGEAISQTDPIFGDACTGEAADSPVCKEAQSTSGSNEDNPIAGPNGIIQDAADIVILVTGIAAVIMIIVSGLIFVSAGGSPERVATARKVFLYSIIGLAIVATSWTIITLVNNNLVNS